MKALAAGKATRPAASRHLAIADGTPTRRRHRHMDAWGARAAGRARPLEALGARRPAAGRRGRHRHMVRAPHAEPPARGSSRLAGQEGGAAAFLHLLSCSCCSSSTSSVPPGSPAGCLPDSPSLSSFSLSFRFLFPDCVHPGLLPGRGARPEPLANSGWDASRCRLHLLVPERLRAVLGELGPWRGPPVSQGRSTAWGCRAERDTSRK